MYKRQELVFDEQDIVFSEEETAVTAVEAELPPADASVTFFEMDLSYTCLLYTSRCV